MKLSARWSKYLLVQNKLANRDDVDDHAWALEGALNRLLDQPLSSAELDRSFRSERRKQRNRRALLRTKLADRHELWEVDEARAVDARAAVCEARRTVGEHEWRLLRAIGEGFEYAELAAAMSTTPAALRVRTLRLRKVLRLRVRALHVRLAS